MINVLLCLRESSHRLLDYIVDDPVRPEISVDFRVCWPNSAVFMEVIDGDRVQAVVCVAFCTRVPVDVEDLYSCVDSSGTVAVFYTIWSYVRGAGRSLIVSVSNWLRDNRVGVTMFVTLSPCSVMAREFHLRNGAVVYRENVSSVNYLYI